MAQTTAQTPQQATASPAASLSTPERPINRAFKEWNEVFPNATCIATLLDRLLHHADVTLPYFGGVVLPDDSQGTVALYLREGADDTFRSFREFHRRQGRRPKDS